jgi:hypothetical protein
LITLTTELLAVVSELPTRKTHNALALPPPSRVRVPVKFIVDEEEYVPGRSVPTPPDPNNPPSMEVAPVDMLVRAVIAVPS